MNDPIMQDFLDAVNNQPPRLVLSHLVDTLTDRDAAFLLRVLLNNRAKVCAQNGDESLLNAIAEANQNLVRAEEDLSTAFEAA